MQKNNLDTAKLRTLIVDDQLLSLKHTERLLQELGFSLIDQASSVTEATEKIAHNAYDIVFIDWYIPPGKSGYQLLQQLREDRKYDTMACVMVSAESGQRFISEAFKTGATAYIVKPVTADAMFAGIEKVLQWLSSVLTQKPLSS